MLTDGLQRYISLGC